MNKALSLIDLCVNALTIHLAQWCHLLAQKTTFSPSYFYILI